MVFGFEVVVFFAILSLVASIVNGGLGYGYSSISIPLAILVLINRVVNPAYVLLEAILNTVMLAFSGTRNISTTFNRTVPMMISVVPGVIVGSLILSYVTPLSVRFLVYVVILPLILLQAAGFRRPISKEARAGVPLGVGVGLLYSITTISGPPIALFWNNQGLTKGEFKATLAQIRVVESYFTAILYYSLGLFTTTSISLFTIISPPVLVGVPLGMIVVRKVMVETFRRICMSFDAWIVGYGLSRTIIPIFSVTEAVAYFSWAIVIAVDLVLLYRFFKNRIPLDQTLPYLERPPSHKT
jgi:uncharacterized membrane protein YfcA